MGTAQDVTDAQDAIPPRPTVWRRLFHAVSGSALPVIAIFTSADVMVGLTATLAGLSIVFEITRLRVPNLNRQAIRWLSPLMKTSERQSVTGATWLIVASLIAFLAFDKPVAIAALLFTSLGDPAAALVGSRMPGPRIAGKSPLGSLAFLIVGVATAAVLVAVDVLEYHWSLGVGAALAAVVELAPLRIDDNLTVPLISGTAITLLLLM